MASTNDGIWRPIASFDKNKIQWPLPYSLTPAPKGARPRKWWEHTYYRGPEHQPVRVLYSCDASNSELIAREFLNEPVLGFDMEWPWDPVKKVEGKVALIQIACEDKIALFHLALHNGKTTEELIVPSLRRIIESAQIMKTGVAIMSGDFRKLTEEFPLQPRGVFELSHLYNLITFGTRSPTEVTTRLRKLSLMAEVHLGLPLDKGPVRISNWNLPLDDKQKTYAANDAYASYMLFHCMNAKRLQMEPKFPLPKLAESYLPFKMVDVVLARLEPEVDGTEAKVLTAMDFSTHHRDGQSSKNAYEGINSSRILMKEKIDQIRKQYGAKSSVTNPVFNQEKSSVDKTITRLRRQYAEASERGHSEKTLSSSDELYQRLVKHRDTEAATEGRHPDVIVRDKALEVLARECPRSLNEISRLNIVDKVGLACYGPSWLKIIEDYLEEQHSKHLNPSAPEISAGSLPKDMFHLPQPRSGGQPLKRARTMDATDPEEFVSSVPAASTGLSFQFDETRLDDDASLKQSDSVRHGGSQERVSESSPLKRKRTECQNPSDAPASTSKDEAAQPGTPSYQQMILRKKLVAYTKSVISEMDPKPTEPIVSTKTIQNLLRMMPRTLDEFNEVPGIRKFSRACKSVNKDLWLTWSTWTRSSDPDLSS